MKYQKKNRQSSLLKDFRKTSFAERVREVVKDIPKGETMTYKEVAAKAGNPGACRAVGNIMSRNQDPKVPCHRVLRSDGKLGGYNGGIEKKIARLRAEGFIWKKSK